jgi:hypothetical protein
MWTKSRATAGFSSSKLIAGACAAPVAGGIGWLGHGPGAPPIANPRGLALRQPFDPIDALPIECGLTITRACILIIAHVFVA